MVFHYKEERWFSICKEGKMVFHFKEGEVTPYFKGCFFPSEGEMGIFSVKKSLSVWGPAAA